MRVLVGSDKDKLMVTSASHSVCSICEEFGKYEKFLVQLEEESPTPCTSASRPNAFTVMATAQRQLQEGDGGVPFSVSVKTNKDKLFNVAPLLCFVLHCTYIYL